MSLCVYVYACMYAYAYIYTYIHVYMYVRMYVYAHLGFPARRTRVIDTAALVSGRFLDD